MSTETILKDATTRMDKAIDHTLKEFNTLHTGKASPAMVDSISVESYGSTMKIKELAAITTPDSRTIVVQPWDRSVLNNVQKAIQTANLGLNPVVDGLLVRCPIPELSKERRQDLVKVAGGMAEEGRISVRAVRRDAIDALKKAQKDNQITEDDLKRYEKEVQQITDKANQQITDHVQNKEKELMAL